MLLEKLHPQTIGKVSRPGGGLEWSDTVTQLVLKMLLHCTPLFCISSNILSVAKFILPNSDVIHQLPGVKFIRLFRGTLSYLTKLLASDELARAPKFLEQHSEGTERWQKDFQHNIVSISKEGGFKHVTLESCILYVNGIG